MGLERHGSGVVCKLNESDLVRSYLSKRSLRKSPIMVFAIVGVLLLYFSCYTQVANLKGSFVVSEFTLYE